MNPVRNFGFHPSSLGGAKLTSFQEQSHETTNSLAWVVAQGEDIVPIPGTKRHSTLDQNLDALKLELTNEEFTQLDALLPKGSTTGVRYPEAMMKLVGR